LAVPTLSVRRAPPGDRPTSWFTRVRRAPGSLAFVLLLPSLVLVFGVVVYPLVRTLVTSLHDVNSAMPGAYAFVGAQNYAELLRDPEFWSSLFRTSSASTSSGWARPGSRCT
jgi:multiple sugar transport system permease protein/N,N'-diacetylchitobiose transport system permease protein